MRAALVCVLLSVLSIGGALAQPVPPPAFFEALYDVPVMPGLEEVKEQAMLFDKPDGRIASVVAASKGLNAAQIERFYEETLPQLGWKKVKQNQYVRGSDRLVMDVTKTPPLTVVHFTLSPDR